MLGFALIFLLSVLILRVVGMITDGFQCDHWGAAVGAMLLCVLGGWAADLAFSTIVPPVTNTLSSMMGEAWVFLGAHVVVNTIMLLLASAIVPGVQVRGVAGPMVAALLISAAGAGMTYVIPFLRLPM